MPVNYTLSMKDFDRLISQRAWTRRAWTRMENKPYMMLDMTPRVTMNISWMMTLSLSLFLTGCSLLSGSTESVTVYMQSGYVDEKALL
jgi:hypothetical protein